MSELVPVGVAGQPVTWFKPGLREINIRNAGVRKSPLEQRIERQIPGRRDQDDAEPDATCSAELVKS